MLLPVRLAPSAAAVLAGLLFAQTGTAQDAPRVLETAALVERGGLVLEGATEQPFTGTVIARHPDGRLRQRYAVLDGRADGAWMEWHETGGVRLYAEWKQGLGDGVWVYFHPNGEISERAQVRDDIWDGVAEGWHENGSKAFESRFDRGVRPDPVRRWTPAGEAFGPWVDLRGGPEVQQVLTEGWPDDQALWDFSVSPDFETLFVATGEPDGAGRQILIRRWRNTAWLPPEAAPFSDPSASEGTPSFSPDGRHLYFSSNRHHTSEPGNPNRELYRASAASGWRIVERVTFTPAYGEVSLSFNGDGRGVLWTGQRIDGEPRSGLYEVRLDPGNGVPSVSIVRSLNDLHSGDRSGESSAAIAPDGRFIVFANYDISGLDTDEDLYVSCRSREGWSRPVSLGPRVNTAGIESSPQIINGSRTLLWRHDNAGVQELRVIELSQDACVDP